MPLYLVISNIVVVNSMLDFFFFLFCSPSSSFMKTHLSTLCLPFFHLCIWYVFYVTPVIHYFQLAISNFGLFIKIRTDDAKYLDPLEPNCLLGCCCRGILIRTLADASTEKQSLSAPQIILNVVGFCVTVATTIFITVYAKKRLKELQTEEEPLLQ